MRFLFISIILTVLTACSGPDYELDFSQTQVYEFSGVQDEPTDSSIQRDDNFHQQMVEWGTPFLSDKTSYKKGESIILTLENKTETEEFFYPSDAEFMPLFEPIEQEEVDKSLVSKQPAIAGQIYEPNKGYFNLMIHCPHKDLVEPFGYPALGLSLEPGESVSFELIPPQVQGTFRVMITRYDRLNGIGGWGLNRSIYSNSFTIE